jgi:hypothetical protein
MSMRKKRAKLNQDRLAELSGKNEDQVTLNQQQMEELGEEIIQGTLEGFNEELQSAPEAIKSLAERFSGIISEFFIGFAEGVRDEIAVMVAAQNQSLAAMVEGVTKATEDSNREFKESVVKALKPEYYDKAASSILPTSMPSGGKQDQKFSSNVFNFIAGMAGGALGLDGLTEKIVNNRSEKETFISNESKLRESEFKERGLSKREIRKELTKDFKTINKEKETIEKFESQKSELVRSGYTEEQAEKIMGEEATTKRNESVAKIAKADRSRISLGEKEAPVIPGNLPELPAPSDSDTPLIPMNDEEKHEEQSEKKKEREQIESQTNLLQEIRDALTNKASATPKDEEGGTGLLGGMGGLLSGVLKKLFNPRTLLKVFTKFLAPAAIIAALGNGIIDGFKEFVKSGSIKEALIAGLGGVLEFLSFGLFDKETVRKIADFVSKKVDEYIVQPIVSFAETVTEMFDKYIAEPFRNVKDFFANIIKDVVSFVTDFEIPGFTVKLPVLGEKTFGPWKPFASDPAASAAEVKEAEGVSDVKSASPTLGFTGAGTTTADSRALTVTPESVASNNNSDISATPAGNYKEPSSVEAMAEISKNIVIQTPPPTVMPSQQSDTKVVPQPFTNIIKNSEPSVSDYLRTRYA